MNVVNVQNEFGRRRGGNSSHGRGRGTRRVCSFRERTRNIVDT